MRRSKKTTWFSLGRRREKEGLVFRGGVLKASEAAHLRLKHNIELWGVRKRGPKKVSGRENHSRIRKGGGINFQIKGRYRVQS